jgi:hypothetical protein
LSRPFLTSHALDFLAGILQNFQGHIDLPLACIFMISYFQFPLPPKRRVKQASLPSLLKIAENQQPINGLTHFPPVSLCIFSVYCRWGPFQMYLLSAGYLEKRLFINPDNKK